MEHTQELLKFIPEGHNIISESYDEIVERRNNIKSFLNTKTTNEKKKIFDYIIVEIKKIINILDDYKKKEFKRMDLNRILPVSDILLPRVKEINVLKKILNMSGDMEFGELEKFNKPHTKKCDRYQTLLKEILHYCCEENLFDYSYTISAYKHIYNLNGKEINIYDHIDNDLLKIKYPKKITTY